MQNCAIFAQQKSNQCVARQRIHLRFCLCSLLRISLDSVSCASFRISVLDSVNVLESIGLDSESALDSICVRDSVDSILPRFCLCACYRI
ncbi:hypothetical protein [uncultured Helicobacter sp.]|uniref:hypothetical protein n=1 Tax=uncultured Helicobacter sp. TaxID=175537 RepID=UPI0037533BDE